MTAPHDLKFTASGNMTEIAVATAEPGIVHERLTFPLVHGQAYLTRSGKPVTYVQGFHLDNGKLFLGEERADDIVADYVAPVATEPTPADSSVPTPDRYENDAAFTGWANTLARDCAAKSDHPYAKEAEHDTKWNAHPWVIEAIKQAYNAGQVDADAKALFVQETMAEQHDALNTSLVRAAIAGVLEATTQGDGLARSSTMLRGGKTDCYQVAVTMNLDAQRTIWDRWDYETSRTEDGKSVQLKIVRKSVQLKIVRK